MRGRRLKKRPVLLVGQGIPLPKLPPGPILALSPHDDDAALGCAGLIADSKRETHVAIMTDGAAGYHRASLKSRIVAVRRAEAERAYRILGCRIHRLGYPDLGLVHFARWNRTGGRPGAYRVVTQLIRRARPGLLLLPNPADWHPDHVATHQIGLVATRIAGDSIAPDLGKAWRVPEAWVYRVWAPLRGDRTHRQSPRARAAKARALAAFRSQAAVVERLPWRGIEVFREVRENNLRGFTAID